MTDKALTTYQPSAIASADSWQVMREQAHILVKSGFLPSSVKTPEAAIAIMMTGAEFGLKPMQSFRMISVIEGKPTMTADGMAALVMQWCRQYGSSAYFRVVETSNDQCIVEYKRPESSPKRYDFTMDDARRAQLTGKAVWQKFPKAMLRARAISAAARMGFPDVVAGVYDPEELGAPVPGEMGEPTTVTDEGEVISVSVAPSMVEMKQAEREQGESEHGEVVDQNTGEIIEDLPQMAANAEDDRERANKAIHAWAHEGGITHGDLHYAAQALFVRRSVQGLRELSATDLRLMHDRLKAKSDLDHEKLLQWLDSVNPDQPRAAQAAETDVIDVSSDDGRLPGVDDNAELDRNIDAVSARARA